MISRLITAPASEPVSVAEAKAHLRIEHSLDDTQIGVLIAVATATVQEMCWRALVTQTWELVLGGFPEGGEVELPRGVLASIESVKYIDSDGVEQTLATSEYEADTDSVPGKLRLAHDKSWPSTRCQYDAVRVRYLVGTAAASVPTPLKQAVLLLVSEMYEHRTPTVFGQTSQVPFAVDALTAPYSLRRF